MHFKSSLLMRLILLFCLLIVPANRIFAQKAPESAGKPWKIQDDVLLQTQITLSREENSEIETNKAYGLAELINIAEERNPQTHVAWQKAKEAAARLGIARSELFPTLAVVAPLVNDSTVLFFTTFFRQNLYLFRPAVELNYTVLDFGERRGRIDAQKAALLAANLNFNEAHRQVIYSVVSAYYKVMLAISRTSAAETTLMNAKTVQEAVEERLAHGLATLPDKLDAEAATAQANYELATVQGEEKVVRGELAAILRVSPLLNLKFTNISGMAGLNADSKSARQSIEDALHFRPDFLAKIQEITAAQSEIKEKKSAYYPKLKLSSNYGHLFGFASQDFSPFSYGHVPVYRWELNLGWTLFDGGRRRNELNEAKSRYARAIAEEQETKDLVEYQVWQAYINLQTAREQLASSESMLAASQKSFEAANEAYHYGVRNLIDVTTAQKNLAIAQNNFVEARIRILRDLAELAFQTGDLVHIGKPVNSPP